MLIVDCKICQIDKLNILLTDITTNFIETDNLKLQIFKNLPEKLNFNEGCQNFIFEKSLSLGSASLSLRGKTQQKFQEYSQE